MTSDTPDGGQTTAPDRRPRAALMFNAFWVHQVGMSGGDRRFLEVFRRIGRRFRTEVFTSADGRRTVGSHFSGAVFAAPARRDAWMGMTLAYMRRALSVPFRILGRRYEILYASSDFFPDVIPCWLSKRCRPSTRWVQCIFHVYPPWRTRPGSRFRNLAGLAAQRFSFWLIRGRADVVVNLSPVTRLQLLQAGFRPERIVVNPCGVDTDAFASVQVPRRSLQACFIGRLVPSKGIDDLIPIWQHVASRVPQAELKVIGSGSPSTVHRLREKVKAVGLRDRIEVLGYVPDDEAVRTLKASQVFLLPSYEEGFGIVVAEALACGVPTVVWDLPVFRELFPRGLVRAPVGDLKAYAEGIVGLLQNPAEARRLAAEGLADVQKYSWDRIAEAEYGILVGAGRNGG